MKKYILLSILSLIINSIIAQNNKTDYHFKYKKGEYFLVNPKGKKVDCEPFTFANKFSEGLAVVERNLQFGYIDSTGNMVIDFQYYDAGPFVNGLAYAAKNGGEYGYINRTGKFIAQAQFDLAFPFGDNYGVVKDMNPDTLVYGNGKMIEGLVTREGQLIGDECFTSIDEKEDYYLAYKGDSVFHIFNDGRKELVKAPKDNGSANDSVFFIVEEMPEYPGGEEALRRYVGSNIRYPLSAQKNGIQQRVYVSFVVDTDGGVIDVVPAQPGSPILLQETIRLLESMPRWKPGSQRGKNVKVSYVIPLNYNLQ